MWYAIISEDIDDSRAGRAEHRELHASGLLVDGGVVVNALDRTPRRAIGSSP